MFEQLMIQRKANGISGVVINEALITPKPATGIFPAAVGFTPNGKMAAFSYYQVSGVYPGFYTLEVGQDGKMKQSGSYIENRFAYNQGFGENIALAPSGNRALLSVIRIGIDTGTVIVFDRDVLTNTWSESGRVRAPVHSSNNEFGVNFKFGPTDDSFFVTSQKEAGGVGRIHEYALVNGTWTFQATLSPNSSAVSNLLGYMMAVSADGNLLVAGNQSLNQVIIFRKFGNIWVQQQVLTPPADWATSPSPAFGSQVSINNDGSVIAVGAGSHVTTPSSRTGALAIYKLDVDVWVFTDAIFGTTGKANAMGVGSVAELDGEGTYVLSYGLASGNVRVLSRFDIDKEGKLKYNWDTIITGDPSGRGLATARDADTWIIGNGTNRSIIYGR